MGVRVNKPEFDQSRFEKSQIGGDYYHEIAGRDLIPRIAERNKQVLNVAYDEFYLFQRGYRGRRCSCWSGSETSPSSTCLICYKTGNTSGYQLYGHQTEVFDVTAPAVLVNVIPDYASVARPIQYLLADKATKGYIDYHVPAVGGINVCSLAELHAVAPAGTRLLVGVKLFSEETYVPLTMDAVTQRLEDAQLEGGFQMRVTFYREGMAMPSPKLSFVRLRFQLFVCDRIRGDIPASAETNKSSEFGWFHSLDEKTLFLDSTVRYISADDIFMHYSTRTLWRTVSVMSKAPMGILLSREVVIELIQGAEIVASLRAY
jgi:hypothetical protein